MHCESEVHVCVCAQTKQEECHKTFPVGRCFSGGLQTQRQEKTPARPVRGRAMFHQTSGSSSSSSTPRPLDLHPLHPPTFARVVFPGNSRAKAGRERVRHRGLSLPGRPRQSCIAAPTQRRVLRKPFPFSAQRLRTPSQLRFPLDSHEVLTAQSDRIHCR